MYYTNYFKGIDISSLSAVCDQCISSLRTAGQTTISFSGIVEPNMSDKLETSLADNKSQIDKLISAIEKIKESLTIAQEIVSKQKAMESETAEAAIASAAEVQTKLKSFCSKIDELSSNFDYLVSSITGLSSTEFKANIPSLEEIKTTFDNYSNTLVTGYDTLEGIKSTVSSDGYLLKAWGIIATRYDFIMKKRDNFDNLLTNYITNIKILESKLPTTTAITNFDDAKTAVYAKTRDNSTEDVSYDSYEKSGRGDEIVIPSTDPYNSNGGSGSYTVNNDGTITYRDKNGNEIGKTIKDTTGLSDYEIAQYKAQGFKTEEEIVAEYNRRKAKAAEIKYAAERRESASNYAAAQKEAEAAANRRAEYNNMSDYEKAQYKAQGYNTIDEVISEKHRRENAASQRQAASNYAAAQKAAAASTPKQTYTAPKNTTPVKKVTNTGYSAGVPGGY